MFPNHPYVAQESRRAVHSNQSQLKNVLYRQGVQIERALRLAMKAFEDECNEQTQSALLIAAGQVQGYVLTRKSLAPIIPTENHVRTLEGLSRKAVASITET